jgi:hypothetical protein
MVHRLAYATSSSGASWWPWVAFGVFVVVAGIGGPIAVRQWRKIRGPVLQGTAEVLSLRQFGRVGGGAGRQICRLRLGVSVPGREPYSVAIWRNISPWNLGAFTKGSTIAIEVSEKNPRKVQLGGSSIQGGSTRHVVNLPPKVTFNQSSWSPESGWTGTPPPGDIADQIKSAVEGAFQASAGQQADAYRQMGGAGPVLSAAALLASGQRVPGALKSFAATGTTPRSLGRTPSRPELIDAPHYMLEVELHFPNLEPIQARAVQPVPVANVPTLSIGLPVVCAVDPSDPSHRFVVDWNAARA